MRELVGLSAACVAWFPYYSDDSLPVRGPFREHWSDSPALPMLFNTGNSEPSAGSLFRFAGSDPQPRTEWLPCSNCD